MMSEIKGLCAAWAADADADSDADIDDISFEAASLHNASIGDDKE